MRILLIGEYSGFYKSLKFGLVQLGHEVLHISAGDGWKSIGSDILISTKSKGSKAFIELFAKYVYHILRNPNFDFVLLINPFILIEKFKSNDILVNLLTKLNGKLVLSVAGDDYFVDKKWFSGEDTPTGYTWVQDSLKIDRPNYLEIFQTYNSKVWNTKILKKVSGIIPTSFEYFTSYEGLHENIEMIPLPFILKATENTQVDRDLSKLNVFHGINRAGAKGSHYILEAKEILEKKYPNDFNFSIVEKLPYEEYLKTFNDTHLFFDQVNSPYLGYNGLEGLAKNKIVLGGAEPIALQSMGILQGECPIVNIKPDVKDIVNKLLALKETAIDKLVEKMDQGRHFVQMNHEAVMIAKRYEDFLLKI